MSAHRFTPFVMVIVLAGISGTSRAASFDCAKARSKVEKAICSDPELGKLDEELAVAYKRALAAHPLPSYVRVRQREWLRVLPDADIPRLKLEYRSRITSLKSAGQVMVYSDAKQTFSNEDGDTAAELWNADGKWRLSVWSQGRIDATKGFTCEFEGSTTEPLKSNGSNFAVNKDGEKLAFAITESTFRFVGSPEICIGMGSIPADLELKRILKK
jgi:uncharacterized protein